MKIENHVCTFEQLKESYSTYISNPDDLKLIEKAYKFADGKHLGQVRKSGDPYVSHCLYVAYILSAILHAGPKTICAGLLHDTIEDTDTTFQDIENEFGNEIATMVEALTKVTRLSDYKNVEFTAENHRKIFVAMAKDIRVIIVKLADRYHNMLTLQYQPREKQIRISNETLDVYAPIAHRLGLYKISTDLEDLSLYYINPDAVKDIEEKCERLVKDSKVTLENIQKNIENILSTTKIPYRISSRVKSTYSIYKKMYLKNYTFDQLYDILALRIITLSEQNCYEILGYIHANFRPMPGRFKDYIAMPKSNMYQSLHTTILTDSGICLEIQIRTEKMDEFDEEGIAAHWRYKEGSHYDPKKEQMEIENRLQWFKDFVAISDENSSAKEYMDTLSHDIFEANVYVFTPKGNVICLPNGATCIDFAYRIHTDLGEHLSGCKVNNVLTPISTKLKTGDIVEIITSKNAFPNSEWLNIAQSNFARNCIRKYLVKKNSNYARDEAIKKGKQILVDALNERKMTFDLNKCITKQLLSDLHLNSADELYLQINGKTISPSTIIEKCNFEKEVNENELKEKLLSKSTSKDTNENLKHNITDSIILENGDNVLTTLANCCQPIPGDEIIGYVSTGQGVKVHRCDCSNITKLVDTSRLIKVKWNPDNIKKADYQVDLAVECHDRDRLLIDIVNNLEANKAKIIKISAKCNQGINTTTILLTLLVKDSETLSHYINNIYQVKSVFNVKRLCK